MKKTLFVLFLSACLSAAALGVAAQALAALGGSVDSIESDRKALSAVRSATMVSPAYTVHEMVSDANTIREYISPAGIVFGIAWNGLAYPDLTQLLGPYADEYQKALGQASRHPGRRHAQVKTNQVIVEKWGHMRNLQGRAYSPSLVPQGVSVDEIK